MTRIRRPRRVWGPAWGLASGLALARTWGLVWALLITLTQGAQAASEVTLQPYSARYSTTAMGLDMTLTRTLQEQDGTFTLTNEGSVLIASLRERAQFQLDQGRIIGQRFTYALGGLVKRKREVQFLPEQGLIRSLRKKRWTEHPWSADILDRLSQQEQLRLDLLSAESPPTELRFRVIDGPRVRERILDRIGNERLDTALGALETVHYRQRHDDPEERSSDIWLAPSLDYMMVRTEHVEDGTRIRIELLELSDSDS